MPTPPKRNIDADVVNDQVDDCGRIKLFRERKRDVSVVADSCAECKGALCRIILQADPWAQCPSDSECDTKSENG